MLGISLAFSMLCGCSRQKQEIPKDTDKSISASKAAEKESPEDEVIAKIRPDETVTFDVYSQLSSYFGEQQGWYAQILLEKFNVKLNFTNDSSEETVGFAQGSVYSGTWADGAAQFNNTTWTPNAANPESNGQTYNYTYWPNVLGKTISGVE